MVEKNVEELEKVLTSLDGIEKAKVIVDEDTGEMKEIHVLSSVDKSSKQIVRDIETAILTIVGERIDRRIISVAQMSGKYLKSGEKNGDGDKFKIDSVGFSEDGIEIEVNVGITKGSAMKEISKRGGKSFKNVLKLSAESAIEAIEGLMTSEIRLTLDEIREVSTGEKRFFLGVMTVLKVGGMSKELVFAGAIGFNPVKNVAEAVIDKVNSTSLDF